MLTPLLAWYRGLSSPGKVVVAIASAFIALTVLNGVLKLVASLITVGILGIVLYALYRAFVNSQPSDTP